MVLKRSRTKKRGGSCGCSMDRMLGGYKPTKRNLKYLRRWKQGKSIGFTMRSSLKAKGLIPRANGTKKVSKIVLNKFFLFLIQFLNRILNLNCYISFYGFMCFVAHECKIGIGKIEDVFDFRIQNHFG